MRSVVKHGGWLMLAMLAGCQQPPPYHIEASVLSERGLGVLIDDIPLTKADKFYSNYDPNAQRIKINPVIPGEFTAKTWLPPLTDAEREGMPDSIEIVYQFAVLTDCVVSRTQQNASINNSGSSKAQVNKKNYMTKEKCVSWEPIPTKKYTKVVSLTQVKNSREFQQWGQRNANGHRMHGVLVLEFLENSDIQIRAESRAINPWK